MIHPPGQVVIDNTKFSVLVASEPYAHAVGLSLYSDVNPLPQDGMWFVLPWLSSTPITMLNCALHLDAAWFDDAGICIGTQELVPFETIAHPPSPYRYALETHAGTLAENEIRVGSRLVYWSDI